MILSDKQILKYNNQVKPKESLLFKDYNLEFKNI